MSLRDEGESVMSELLSFRSLYARDERHAILAGLSLHVNRGETVAIVGESGCGKTMSIGALLSILPDDVLITSGSIIFDGEDVLKYSGKERMARLYSRIGFVPQNTSDSLYPLMTVSKVMTDAYVRSHPDAGRKHAAEKAAILLSSLGIEDAERVLSLYPFQLSGGMKQRINIASALMDDIDLLVADEPTSALDIHIRRQIESLYASLSGREGLAMLVVSHDLSFVRSIADRVYVMYAGRIIEEGLCDEIFSDPAHPYTKALMTLGTMRARDREHDLPEFGRPSSDIDRESPACAFLPRCSCRKDQCAGPVGYACISDTHFVRCVL